MRKKYLFIDFDGTIFDHVTQSIPESTTKAIKQAKTNGHEVILCTGRPPCLFYGADKTLEIDSYVAANGRVVVHKGEVIKSDNLSIEDMERVIELGNDLGVDVSVHGIEEMKVITDNDEVYKDFASYFHQHTPDIDPEYYKENDIYQMTLYYTEDDYGKFNGMFPNLGFVYACKYGIDVNTKGGLKEEGIKAFVDKFDIDLNDIIAIGDGYNDITMFNYVKTSVAMGNAHSDVKKHATMVTDSISNDGVSKALKKLNLI